MTQQPTVVFQTDNSLFEKIAFKNAVSHPRQETCLFLIMSSYVPYN